MEICDFCSATCFVGDGGRFAADCVMSARGLDESRLDRVADGSGDAEGEGVGSEDCSCVGVTDSRRLRDNAELFLFF